MFPSATNKIINLPIGWLVLPQGILIVCLFTEGWLEVATFLNLLRIGRVLSYSEGALVAKIILKHLRTACFASTTPSLSCVGP